MRPGDPEIEVMGLSPRDDPEATAALRNRRRIRVFGLIFLIAATAGLGFDFSRPPVYVSQAKLLIEPPAAAGADDAAKAKAAAIQREVLASGPILAQLADRLAEKQPTGGPAPLGLAGLLGMVTVAQIADTNMLALRAEGPDADILAPILNDWTEVYLASLADRQSATSEDVDSALQLRLTELEEKVSDKRKELDWFRRQNDIVSMERDENQILARLKGLTEALNEASAEEVNAKARFDAIAAAIAAGKPVARDQDERVIAGFEQRMLELGERIKEFEQKFTPQYIAMDPDTQVLIRQYKLVKERLAATREMTRQAALSEAEQNYASAHQAGLTLRGQLADYRQIASEFTTRFAEHESLREELAQLEQHFREAQGELLRQQVDGPAQLMTVNILEPATRPVAPRRPLYGRDAAIAVAGALVLGFLAVLFIEFFNRPARQAFGGIAVPVPYPVRDLGHLEAPTGPGRLLDQPARQLADDGRRELSTREIGDMIAAADGPVRLLIGILMSGATRDEAAALCWSHLDTDRRVIRLAGTGARDIAMPSALKALVLDLTPDDIDAGTPLWSNTGGEAADSATLDAMVTCAAHDGGVERAEAVSAETLRHSYLAWLVRQGARLGELARIAGHIPPVQLSAYAALSPPGPGLSLDEMILTHPAMKALPRT